MSQVVVPESSRSRSRWALAMIAVAFVLGASLLLWVPRGQPRILSVNQEWMADDFGFTLRDQAWLRSVNVAESTIKPNGIFLVLEFQVANHAKRVDFEFQPRQIELTSADGQRFRITPEGQAALDPDGANPTHLAPGESCMRRVVFDVPRSVGPLRARVAFGGRLGEVLDWLFFGERWFQIQPTPDSPSAT